jgi:hypothetical protein
MGAGPSCRVGDLTQARRGNMLVTKTRLFGGSGGLPFSDSAERISGIARIVVYSGELVDRVQVTYNLETGEKLVRAYGGEGGIEGAEIILEDDERICGVTVRCGEYVDSLAFITYRMFNLAGLRRYGPFGGPGGTAFTILSPHIRELFGRSGTQLDAIGFRCEEPMLVCG